MRYAPARRIGGLRVMRKNVTANTCFNNNRLFLSSVILAKTEKTDWCRRIYFLAYFLAISGNSDYNFKMD